MKKRKARCPPPPPASSLRYDSRTVLIKGFIKSTYTWRRGSREFGFAQQLDVSRAFKVLGEKEKRGFQSSLPGTCLCQVECWELGARRELSKTSTLGSVPGVLCLPMVLSNHHSAAMERAKVPQIQVLLYIQDLGVQGVQEAPVVP